MRFALLATAACIVSLAAHSAHAMSLEEALSAAYENNPTLKAERKQMEGAFEAVPDANSGLLPTITGHYDNGNERGNVNNGRDQKFHSKGYRLNLSQPLFRGFRTYNALQQSEYIVKAATFALQNAEQRVLLEAVNSYLDVARTREIYKLNQHNENVLGEQLEATGDRFKLGETTRTDVAQAESRRAAATSRRITAHGDMVTAESDFRRIYQIEPPEDIAITETLPVTPESMDKLITEALNNDPALKLAYFNSETAKESIDIAKGVLLPTVTLDGSTQKRSGGGVGQLNQMEDEAITVNVSVPLYQGGGEYADVRRARKTAEENAFRLDQERNNTVDRATAAWESLVTARGAIDAQKSSVDSAKLALEGVKQEQEVGSRTVLDVLDAEQELFQAQVNLITAKRNYASAAYTVLSSVGALTAQGLKLPVDKYDPQEEYDRLKYKFIGF